MRGHRGEGVRLDEDPRRGDEEVRVAARELVGGDDQARGGGERVGTLVAAGRARVVGAAVEGERQPQARRERAHLARGGAEPGEVARLVDVQLDEAAQPREPGRRVAERGRVGAERAHRVAEQHARVVGARERVADVEPADQRARAERRGVEARALLVGEGEHGDAADPLGDREARRDAERAVEAATGAHAVEVRAGRPPGPLVLRHRPERAGRIAQHAEPGGARLRPEPLLGRGQLLRPRQPRDARGPRRRGIERGEPVAQLGGADHRVTRQAWSGRTQASSPPATTIATGLWPSR